MTTTRRTLLAAVAAVTLGGVVACSTPADDTAGHEIPRIATDWIAAWNSADPDRLADLFVDDARYTDHAFGPTFTGRDGVTTWATMTNEGVADIELTLDDAFRDEDRVSIRWTFDGQLVGAPAPFSVPAVTVLQLQGDEIVANDDFYDLADVLRQSGLPADTTFDQP